MFTSDLPTYSYLTTYDVMMSCTHKVYLCFLSLSVSAVVTSCLAYVLLLTRFLAAVAGGLHVLYAREQTDANHKQTLYMHDTNASDGKTGASH